MIATTLSIDRFKTTKQLEKYLTEADFKKIRESSSLLANLLQLDSNSDRELMENPANELSDYTKLVKVLRPEAHKLLSDQLDAHLQEYRSLTKGVVDLPLREAPFANKSLI